MRQITPYLVWVGHAGDGQAFREVFDLGIRAIVQLAAEEPTIPAPRELVYFRFPLMDGTGNDPDVLDLAIRSVEALLQERIPTLVCCGAGMSRSPAVLAAALMTVRMTGFDECLKFVTECRPVDLSSGLFVEIKSAIQRLALGKPG